MDEAWITTNLKDQLDSTGTNVILLVDDNGGQHTISIVSMAAMFSGVSVPVTHAELSTTPQAAGGWQRYFDDWKAKGYIS